MSEIHYIDKEKHPLPKSRKGGPYTPRISRNYYPFADMNIGDSFLSQTATSTQLAVAAHSWAKYQAEVHSQPWCKFATRQLPEGVRIWRIS